MPVQCPPFQTTHHIVSHHSRLPTDSFPPAQVSLLAPTLGGRVLPRHPLFLDLRSMLSICISPCNYHSLILSPMEPFSWSCILCLPHHLPNQACPHDHSPTQHHSQYQCSCLSPTPVHLHFSLFQPLSRPTYSPNDLLSSVNAKLSFNSTWSLPLPALSTHYSHFNPCSHQLADLDHPLMNCSPSSRTLALE